MATKSMLRVLANKYTVGDLINGKTIASLGDSWTEMQADASHFCGQQWEECSCGNEPIYMPHDMCDKCIHNTYGKPVALCYAYFE